MQAGKFELAARVSLKTKLEGASGPETRLLETVWYAPGVGRILTMDPKGHVTQELVTVEHTEPHELPERTGDGLQLNLLAEAQLERYFGAIQAGNVEAAREFLDATNPYVLEPGSNDDRAIRAYVTLFRYEILEVQVDSSGRKAVALVRHSEPERACSSKHIEALAHEDPRLLQDDPPEDAFQAWLKKIRGSAGVCPMVAKSQRYLLQGPQRWTITAREDIE